MSHAAEHYLPATSDYSVEETRGVYRKVILRLLPYLVLAYAINTIDRLNVSFAKLRMAEDIGLTDAAYGLGAGIFYLGYILFEVPSNIYLQRTGARATLTRIMVLWGMVTVATAFVTTADQLIVARFLLGVAEAGFFPGVILYLTYWFPPALRARITAVFLMAAMVAGIISGPLAGTIMSHFHGWLGLRDWQVLFVLEGVPAMLLGLFGWFWLVDKPDDARWLTAQEKHMLAACLAHGRPADTPNASLVQVLRNPQVYIAGLVFFCIYSGSNTVSYWMPTLIRGFGVQDLKSIGLLASVPYMGALIGMYLLARSSDKRLERRWHVSLTLMLSATCFFLLGPVQDHLVLSVVFMSIGAAAALSALSLFWSIPPALLSPSAAAVGIAVISCIGGLAGVISQIVVGAIKTATGDLYLAFDVIAGVLVVGAVVLLVAIPASQLKERVKA